MDVREHYAMDVPCGVRLVGGGWDGLVVQRARWLDRPEPTVELTLYGDALRGEGYSYATVQCHAHRILAADHDAPERQERLAFARALVGQGAS